MMCFCGQLSGPPINNFAQFLSTDEKSYANHSITTRQKLTKSAKFLIVHTFAHSVLFFIKFLP